MRVSSKVLRYSTDCQSDCSFPLLPVRYALLLINRAFILCFTSFDLIPFSFFSESLHNHFLCAFGCLQRHSVHRKSISISWEIRAQNERNMFYFASFLRFPINSTWGDMANDVLWYERPTYTRLHNLQPLNLERKKIPTKNLQELTTSIETWNEHRATEEKHHLKHPESKLFLCYDTTMTQTLSVQTEQHQMQPTHTAIPDFHRNANKNEIFARISKMEMEKRAEFSAWRFFLFPHLIRFAIRMDLLLKWCQMIFVQVCISERRNNNCSIVNGSVSLPFAHNSNMWAQCKRAVLQSLSQSGLPPEKESDIKMYDKMKCFSTLGVNIIYNKYCRKQIYYYFISSTKWFSYQSSFTMLDIPNT